MRRTLKLGLMLMVGACLCAVPATAAPTGTVRLNPNTAGSAAEVAVDLQPGLSPTSETPQSVAISTVRGFVIDPRAVAVLCTEAQAANQACPAASRVGDGHVEVTISGYLGPGSNVDAIGVAQAYLGTPVLAGDVASVVLLIKEPISGRQTVQRGRIVRLANGPYGYEISFQGLSAQLPDGVTLNIHRIEFHGSGSRSVKKRVVVRTRRGRRRVRHRTVTYRLFRNPSTCSGAWPFEVSAIFASGPQTTVGRVACSK
jgi:hypothetical protein